MFGIFRLIMIFPSLLIVCLLISCNRYTTCSFDLPMYILTEDILDSINDREFPKIDYEIINQFFHDGEESQYKSRHLYYDIYRDSSNCYESQLIAQVGGAGGIEVYVYLLVYNGNDTIVVKVGEKLADCAHTNLLLSRFESNKIEREHIYQQFECDTDSKLWSRSHYDNIVVQPSWIKVD